MKKKFMIKKIGSKKVLVTLIFWSKKNFYTKDEHFLDLIASQIAINNLIPILPECGNYLNLILI